MAHAEVDLRNESAGQVIVHSATNFVKRHYVVSSFWMIGLVVTLLATGYTVDGKTKVQYQQELQNARDIEETEVAVAYDRLQATYDRYYNSKGWFWRCDSDCTANYEAYLHERDRVYEAEAQRDAALSKARSIVGIFSEYGVQDTRDLFWTSWEQGKALARRMSFYDAIFMAFDHNDSIWAYLIQLVLRVIINFSLGFITAMISFLWNLIWFVRTYQAGIMGVIFWLLAASAAFTITSSVIGGMVGTVAAVAYAGSQQRLEGATFQQQRRVHGRPHWD